MKNKQPKTHCSICSRPIFDSVNPEKIITCARCVQILLIATQENKIEYRNSLISEGYTEQARSVEAFISDIPCEIVPTFKASRPQMGSKRVQTTFKLAPIGVSRAIGGSNEI